MAAIQAITFDLWDTIIIDDSDEPKRAALDLPPKPIERRELTHRFLSEHAKPISPKEVDWAYDAVDAAFRKVWHEMHVTWTVEERIDVLLDGLKRSLPKAAKAELVELHEQMELAVRPDLLQGMGPVLEALHRDYRLGVISDTIFSPGSALRQLLEDEGLAQHFDAFIFSDEAGCSKPAPAAFSKAAEALSVPIESIVHIGDREHNDVAGPHAVGAKAILTTVIKDRGSNESKADAICDDYAKLADLIRSLGSDPE